MKQLVSTRFAIRFTAPFATAAAALLLAACAATAPGTASDGSLSAERIHQSVPAPERSEADRVNDQRRKPEPMLAFIGIHPGITALDLSAGGGYTTELLARAIGPQGRVYGQGRPPQAAPSAPAAAEGNSHPNLATAKPAPRRSTAEALQARSAALQQAGVAAAPITAVQQPFEDPIPAAVAHGSLDLVTLMFNYHDLGHLGVDRAAMNRAVFQALKPGGQYVIADHAGRDGTGISEAGTLHRIEEAFLKREVEAAGFKLQAEADFLRNPKDPRDQNTPNPPQPKDEFVLKFVKP